MRSVLILLLCSFLLSCQDKTNQYSKEDIAEEVIRVEEERKIKEAIDMELIKLVAKGNIDGVDISVDELYKKYYQVHEDSLKQKIDLINQLKEKY